MKLLRHLLLIICLFAGINSRAQTNKRTLRVLFVGNSYTFVYNMPHLVALLSDSTNTKVITYKSVIGAARLSNHWKGERGLKTKEIIKNGKFDIVVLQEQSTNPITQRDSFLVYAKKLSDYTRENGAKPYLYSTWPKAKTPQMLDTISNAYAKSAAQTGAVLVKVGEAWKLAKEQRPDIQLYFSDDTHPSPIGAFLTACVFTKVLTGELPKTFPTEKFILDANNEQVLVQFMAKADIDFCLNVARQVVK